MRRWLRLAAAGALLLALTGALVLSAAGLRSPAEHRQPADNRRPLRFASGGFKVALFADLHYGENAWTDWGPRQDAGSDRVMDAVLDAEKPGPVPHLPCFPSLPRAYVPAKLQLFSEISYWRGNCRLCGVSRRPSDGEQYADSQRELVLGQGNFSHRRQGDPMGNSVWEPRRHAVRVASGVVLSCRGSTGALPASEHVSFSFRGTTRIELMTSEINHNGLSYSSNGPMDLWPGVSNYDLQVLSHKKGDPALLMYFLDSGGGSYPEVISSAQVKWFQSRSQFLNPNGRIPEIIFWHIPSTAYVKVAPKAKSEIRKPCVGSINKEEVAPQEAEWGMMDALAKRPSVKAIFVGHNHGLDWCCPYEKLWLCFARHTGYGGYGDWPRGARIVEITEDPLSIESWIRMENGTKHSDIILTP